MLNRRTLLAGATGLAALATTSRAYAGETLRIGYQKIGSLVVLRQQKRLEAALAPQGVSVQWNAFNAGPPLMEALAAGAIDVGYAGDMPPIFAQAGGADIVYIAAQPIIGHSEAILVRKDGPIHDVAGLRGRRVAYTRGSSAHNMLVTTLEQAGMTLADIQSVPMQPSDAAAAFRTGAIDAWAIWDPFLAIAEQDPATEVLIEESAVAPTNSFFLARRAYATASAPHLVTLLAAINQAATWAAAHPGDLATLMADLTGVPLPAQTIAAARGVYVALPITAAIIAQQQAIADRFARLHIIPTPIDIRAAVWQPPQA